MSVQDQIDHLIALRAAQWYEEWRTGELQDVAELRAWLTESPRHLDTFLSIAGQDVALREAFLAGRVDAPSRFAQDDWTNIHPISQLPGPAAEVRSGGFVWGRKLQVAAATLGVLAVAIGLWLWSAAQWTEYATSVGEQRTVRLIDGSVVKLNAKSSLRVRFDAFGRELRLSGEALFKVAHDSSRPFEVHTPTTWVRAVGTEFNVYSRPDGRVTVSVLEGQVNVRPERPLAAQAARGASARSMVIAAHAGEQVEVVGTGELFQAPKPDVRAAVAWQDRKLVFKYTPLEEIVAEFNRYNAVELRIESLPSGPLSFTGVFDADDPQEFALLLSQEPDLDVRRGSHEIVIRSRERPQ